MREDEDRRVERRVGAPGALPLRVLVPPGVPELSGAHDLGADFRVVVLADEGVVDSGAAAGLPPVGREHPLVEPVAGVPEMRVAVLAFAGAESVERDREILYSYAGHGWQSFGFPKWTGSYRHDQHGTLPV